MFSFFLFLSKKIEIQVYFHFPLGPGAGGMGAPLHNTPGGALILTSPLLLCGAPHHPPLLHLDDNRSGCPKPALHV